MSKKKPSKQMRQLRDKWIEILNEGHQVTFEWDCGGDETLVDTLIDGKSIDYCEAEDLVQLLIVELDLPNAGEWFVKGSGELLSSDGSLQVRHKSHCSGASWDHVDMSGDDWDPASFDWEANVKYVEREVEELVTVVESN